MGVPRRKGQQMKTLIIFLFLSGTAFADLYGASTNPENMHEFSIRPEPKEVVPEPVVTVERYDEALLRNDPSVLVSRGKEKKASDHASQSTSNKRDMGTPPPSDVIVTASWSEQ